jgi:hypothetical protein
MPGWFMLTGRRNPSLIQVSASACTLVCLDGRSSEGRASTASGELGRRQAGRSALHE